MNAIEIRNLSKRFGSKQAVDGLNMTVPAGAIYGFIGENGSGKSTTEKLICGHLVPSGGHIRLFDKDRLPANSVQVINQYVANEGLHGNRYDVTVLVNG